MHAFAMHVPQFLSLHGNITIFTQQELEKLNDVTTKYFQRSSNHHEMGSLKQILEKHNRLEALEDGGHQRVKQIESVVYVIVQVIISILVSKLLN